MAGRVNSTNRRVQSLTHMARRSKIALTCKQETEFIARYIAGELRKPMIRAFEQHLGLCPDCVAFLKTYKATVELTREFLSDAAAQPPVLSVELQKTRAKR
jgi:anti-sigma factor RsiW